MANVALRNVHKTYPGGVEAIKGINFEVGDDLVGRIDAHLDRQHQCNEDDPENRHPERKAEIHDGVGGDDRNRNLADCNQHRHHE